ncbi:cannabinoid receptor 1-like [Magallana gigas]|uniref:cannabinoid receptor 1-like n=1 Tax=Magallana gigas TaxID=29159 RepID=UPI00333F02AD
MRMSNCTECELKADNLTEINPFSKPIAYMGLLLAIVIITLNLTVLLVFLKSKSVRANRHHNLVICLSICDLSIGFNGVILSVRLLVPAWSGLYVPCILTVVITAVGIFMSLFQTFLISFHRFLVSIDSPWNDRLLQGKRKYAIIFLSWSVVLILNYGFIRPTSKEIKMCNVKIIYGNNFRSFIAGYGSMSMIIMLSTCIIYIFTLNRVRKRYSRTFAWQIENNQNRTSTNTSHENTLYITEVGKKKVFESLKVVGIIISLLVLLTGPFVIVMFMTVFQFEPSHTLIFTVCLLASVNSAINPFIYGWKIDSLRKEFKTLFQVCLVN